MLLSGIIGLGSNRPKAARASSLMQQSVRSGSKKKDKEVASTVSKEQLKK